MMGWNDHVDFREMRCLDCGAESTWEFWDAVAIARYGNDLGKKLGHDVADHGHCPDCGSRRGIESDDED